MRACQPLPSEGTPRRALTHFRVRGWGTIDLGDGGKCREIHMRRNWTRRRVLQATLLAGATLVAAPRLSRAKEVPQRTIVVMCDGLGLEYYDRSAMPTLKAWAAKGIYTRAQAVMPTVTNCNNTSICCGVWPSEHGVIGNSYFDQKSGTEEYMEDAKLVLAPTIFERARVRGVRSALL
jgi:hypothetical protein